MGPSPSVARWHRQRIPVHLAGVLSVAMGGTRGRPAPLAPQLRGQVAPRVLTALEQRGWHVHRIGSAAYVHGPDRRDHFLFGVWRRRATPPAWARRLGRASAGYLRRLERVALEQRWRRQLRTETGQFSVLRPWTHWPTPAAYSFEPAGPSVSDQVDELEAASRRRWIQSFPPDAPELELRAMDGDR